jgi:hypothetical protein
VAKQEASKNLSFDSVGFLLGILFDPEDGCDMFLRNVWLSPTTRPYNPEDIIYRYHFDRNVGFDIDN